jgi:hypothetical protein
MTQMSDNSKNPSPASTVILTRQNDGELQVYLLRRSHRSSFMPGNYVFQGSGTMTAYGGPLGCECEQFLFPLEPWRFFVQKGLDALLMIFGIGGKQKLVRVHIAPCPVKGTGYSVYGLFCH